MATDRVDALVIFGATGDLAKLETFPALVGLVKRGVLGVPVHRDLGDLGPLGAGVVGLALAPAQRGDLVTGPDQPGNQVGADVPGGSDDDDAAHGQVLPALVTLSPASSHGETLCLDLNLVTGWTLRPD